MPISETGRANILKYGCGTFDLLCYFYINTITILVCRCPVHVVCRCEMCSRASNVCNCLWQIENGFPEVGKSQSPKDTRQSSFPKSFEWSTRIKAELEKFLATGVCPHVNTRCNTCAPILATSEQVECDNDLSPNKTGNVEGDNSRDITTDMHLACSCEFTNVYQQECSENKVKDNEGNPLIDMQLPDSSPFDMPLPDSSPFDSALPESGLFDSTLPKSGLFDSTLPKSGLFDISFTGSDCIHKANRTFQIEPLKVGRGQLNDKELNNRHIRYMYSNQTILTTVSIHGDPLICSEHSNKDLRTNVAVLSTLQLAMFVGKSELVDEILRCRKILRSDEIYGEKDNFIDIRISVIHRQPSVFRSLLPTNIQEQQASFIDIELWDDYDVLLEFLTSYDLLKIVFNIHKNLTTRSRRGGQVGWKESYGYSRNQKFFVRCLTFALKANKKHAVFELLNTGLKYTDERRLHDHMISDDVISDMVLHKRYDILQRLAESPGSNIARKILCIAAQHSEYSHSRLTWWISKGYDFIFLLDCGLTSL